MIAAVCIDRFHCLLCFETEATESSLAQHLRYGGQPSSPDDSNAAPDAACMPFLSGLQSLNGHVWILT
jgi:hypothetical protein